MLRAFPCCVRSVDNGSSFPPQLLHRADTLVGSCFAPPDPAANRGESGKLLLRSHGFLCLVDLGMPVPSDARIHPPSHLAARNDLARRSRLRAYAERRERSADCNDPIGGGIERKKAVLSPAALAAMEAAVGAAMGKRARSNSVNSATSHDSAKLVPGLTPRRLRSDSVTSAADSDAGAPPALPPDSGSEDEASGSSRNFALTLKYRPVIFAGFLGPSELVVVEEPWLKIMAKLPDPIYRQRFGT